MWGHLLRVTLGLGFIVLLFVLTAHRGFVFFLGSFLVTALLRIESLRKRPPEARRRWRLAFYVGLSLTLGIGGWVVWQIADGRRVPPPLPIHIKIAQSGQRIVRAIYTYRRAKGHFPPDLQVLVPRYLKDASVTNKWGYTSFQEQFLLSTNHPVYKDRVIYQVRPVPGWYYDFDDGKNHPMPSSLLKR